MSAGEDIIKDAKGESILHAQDYLQMLKSRWKEALLVFLLVCVSCAVVTRMAVPMYRSYSRFEIKLPSSIVDPLGERGSSPIQQSMNEYYMTTQYQVLICEMNRMKIAEKLKLDKEWQTSVAGAAGALLGMIEVKPLRGTDMVDITVTGSDPQIVKRICDAVPSVYAELRESKENALIDKAINTRFVVLRARQDELERKADIVRQYIRTGRYLSPDIWNGGGDVFGSGKMVENTVSSRVTRVNDLEAEISTMSVHIEGLQKLKDEELLNYALRTGLLTAESFSSNKVRALNDQFKEEEDQRREMLMSGYGELHPQVKRLDAQHKESSLDLFAELIGMREAMENQLKTKKAELSAVYAQLDESKGELKDKMIEDQKLHMALEDYTAEKQRFGRLENDYIIDKTRMLTPRQTIEIYSKPVVATVPSSPNYKLNLTAGAVVGIMAGVAVAFIYNYFDTSVKTLEQAEQLLKLPVFGVIPQDVGLLSTQDGNSPDAEAYRILRTNIELKKHLYKSNVYAITSANAGEGKSTTLCNLAYVFAQSGYSVLMIDADLRRPRLARYSEVQAEVGLSNYLSSDMELKDVVVKSPTPNLYLLPSGAAPADPSGLIASYRMDQLLKEAAHRFDVVLVDSPPILGVSEASLLVNKCDATLLVLQPRKMPIRAINRAKNTIDAAGGKIMGIVMNNVDITSDSHYQYYTTYYSYYTAGRNRKEPQALERREALSALKSEKSVNAVDSDSPSLDDKDIY